MNQTISKVVSQAKEFMGANSIDGWLLYDYRGMNPIFWDTVGEIPNVTRPCWLWIPTDAMPRLIVSYVDQMYEKSTAEKANNDFILCIDFQNSPR